MALIDKLINIANTIRNMTDLTDNMTLNDMNTRLNEFNLQMKLYCYESGFDEYYVDLDCYLGHPMNKNNYYYILKKNDSGSLFQESDKGGGYGILQSDGSILTADGTRSLTKNSSKTVVVYAYFSE